MVYSIDSLYIWGGIDQNMNFIAELYRYEINTAIWTIEQISEINKKQATGYGLCAFEDSLYMINGYNSSTDRFYKEITRLNLETETRQWEIFYTFDIKMPQGAFGYICSENTVFIYNGLSEDGYRNELISINLIQSDPKITILSASMNVPTSRYGHAMEVYNDKLYIFGGVDSYGNE